MLGGIPALGKENGKGGHLCWDASAVVKQAVGRSQRSWTPCAGARASYSGKQMSDILQ